MPMRKPVLILFFMVVVAACPARAKVILRWTEPAIPAAKSLGVSDVALTFDACRSPLLESARRAGYRVFVEATPQQAAELAPAAAKKGIAGFIISVGDAERSAFDAQLEKLRSAHPKLIFRGLNSHGKRPQIRGRMVVEHNGILHVSSPSSQPWVDSNHALVRFEQAFHPGETPLYTFQWELTDTLQRQLGPSAADYSLAIAEAGALRSDLLLNLHAPLQIALAQRDPGAWTLWKDVRKYLEFSAHAAAGSDQALAYVGVITDDFNKSYEAVNLLARHNIPFRISPPARLSLDTFADLDIVILFAAPDKKSADAVFAFAKQGGTAVLVNIRGEFPWQSAAKSKVGEEAASYATGRGRVIEYPGPVLDPETFAVDIRRLMGNRKTIISLWNSLTTVVVPYRDTKSGKTTLELINYAEEPLEVQLQMKGTYRQARYSTPELGCCQAIVPVERDGFTDLLAHKLVIAGRADLEPAAKRDRK